MGINQSHQESSSHLSFEASNNPQQSHNHNIPGRCLMDTQINIEFSPNSFQISDQTYDNIMNCNLVHGQYKPDPKHMALFRFCDFEKPIFLSNHKIYIGQWNQGFQVGYCQIFQNNKQYYVGFNFLGEPHGHGRMIYEDGEFYEGEWNMGQPAHNGKFYNKVGQVSYEQKQDTKSLKKKRPNQIINNKFIYYGEMKCGRRHGFGLCEWNDGTYYLGYFNDNQLHGVGEMHFINGNIYKGKFFQNKFQGIGHFKWADGRVYFGRYNNDQKNGFGIYDGKDGKIYQGFFKNGKQHGIAQLINTNSQYKQLSYWEKGHKFTDEELKKRNISFKHYSDI